jgi:hypothetical protein
MEYEAMTENWPASHPDTFQAILDERNPQPAGKSNRLLIPALPFGLSTENAGTLLDPQETTPSNRMKPTYRQQFMQFCEPEYLATVEAYERIYPHPSDGSRYALANCRKHAYFAMDRISGDVKVMSDSCRERWCPMCAAQKAKFAKESCQQYIESLKSPRFLTLTLRHCEDDLKPQVEFLQDAFRRLRTRAYWKKRVFGGVWFLQVHRSENDGCWHPHLHILLDGAYLEHGTLSDLWDLVSYGSPVLDIRKIHNPESSASYVARYSARPAKFEAMPIADRVEMITSLKGKRLSGTFGTAKCITLTTPKITSDADWTRIGFYDTLVKDAMTDLKAQVILLAYNLDHPITDEEFEAYTGHAVNPVFCEPVEKKPVQYLLDFFNTS